MAKSDSEVPRKPASPDAGRTGAGSRATPSPSPAEREAISMETEFQSLPENGGTSSSRMRALEDLQGRQLGEFQLLRRLGRGGMAEVYLAEQLSLKRNVAVKVLRGDIIDTDDLLIKRFEQEAKAAGSLNHPNIIQVYAIGTDSGIHYIAQEYVQGMNLREFITKRGVPDLTVALHIMRQTAAALEAAGDAGIVHRDIKPENIMITRKGKVKVADFGLAQLTHSGERVNLTQVGMTMGTPLYMSPEQVNGSKVDQRSDLYSFGVTCYHMLTGQPPFRGPTAMSIAVKHLKEEPQPLQERRPDLPPALCQIVHRMMAKEPGQRYANAQALLADLKKLARIVKEQPDAAAELTLSAAAMPVDPARRAVAPGWMVRHPVAAFVICCLLAGSASAGVGWWMRPENPLRAPVTASPKIPRQSSAAEQYYRAKLYLPDDEAAWQAVVEHFSNDRLWTQRARAQLAFIYLRNRRWDDAEKIFTELSATGDDPALKATGFVGNAILASLRGQHEESQRIIAFSVEPLRQSIPADVSRVLQETIARNRKVLGDKVRQGYEEMFNTGPG